jgi:hypothetical protein
VIGSLRCPLRLEVPDPAQLASGSQWSVRPM